MIKQALKWDISAGVALMRAPVIAPPMTDVEQRYDEACHATENELSLRSNFEIRAIKDQELLLKRQKLEEEGRDLSQLDEQIGVTAIQREQEWEQHEKAMREQHRVGDLSTVQSEDAKSLRYKLDRKVVLLVQQKFDSNTSPWILPQQKNTGETLRQTVERCLGETFSGNVNISIDGNAPMCFHKHRYPKPLAEKLGAHGNLIFIYSAYINELDRPIKFNNAFIKDYAWCSSDQLDLLIPEKRREYRSKIRPLLFE